MEIKKLRKQEDDAVVGIVVVILTIGLIMVIMVMVKTIYVPQWLEQQESLHMEEVSNQFTQLKYALDIQSAVEQNNAISSSITLGSKDIPFFNLGRTFGTVEIIENDCNLIITNDMDTKNFQFETITYSSENNYFIDQSYIYEAGLLILNQNNANILLGKPFLSVSNFTNISCTLVNILGVDGKRSLSGFGTYGVYTEFIKNDYYEILNVSHIIIETNYQNAWRTVLNSYSLKYSGLEYVIQDTDKGLVVEFKYPYGNLFLKIVDISAQLSPGWIK